MEKTEIMRREIHREVVEALVNSRLRYDHPMRDTLEGEAQIVGSAGHACVRILDANGNWLRLEDRIRELKTDPRFCDSVPDPPKIARGNLDEIRDNFDAIARGEVEVVK